MPTTDTVTAADIAVTRRVLDALTAANAADDSSVTRAVARVRDGLDRHDLAGTAR